MSKRRYLCGGSAMVVVLATSLAGQALAAEATTPSTTVEEVVVTDSIPLTAEATALGKIRVLSTASLLSDAIRRIYSGDSLSSLFL